MLAVKWLPTLVLFVLALIPASGYAEPESLRVATRIIRPFVFEEGGRLTGFSIDLWQEISAQLNVQTEFIVKGTLRELLDATLNDEADVGIAAISITEERERDWDFSHPMFDAGLQILIPQEGEGGDLGSLAGSLFNARFLPLVIFVIVGALLAGHIVWLFERKRTDGFLNSPNYFPGIFESTFWATTTLATQAEGWPKSAVARVVSVFWMFVAVLFVAIFTAAVTSELTVQKLRSEIQGPEDLPGKIVATVRNSTSARYLSANAIHTTEFNSVEEAIQALEKGDPDAIVFDAPVLQYYASHEGTGKVQVVGPVFRKEAYGIQFPKDSRWRKVVNEALLRLRENGTYDRLLVKWFGGEGGKGGR
ncbi:MAG TPA: transporter substrate-binding domain-containing protein [Chloroflexota bacterium]